MRRPTAVLLALLAGILLEAGLFAPERGGDVACAAERSPLGPHEPFTTDSPAPAKPFLPGGSPEPFSAALAASGPAPVATFDAAAAAPGYRSPPPSRPVYLTTLRLRI